MENMEFQEYLRQELINRCKHNPKYSMRSFARALGTDPSTLSKILSGKRRIGKNFVHKMGKKLGLDDEQIKKLIPINPHKVDTSDDQYLQLTLDQFKIIGEWQHFAIISLMEVKDFQANPKWIASCLGIEENEVEESIKRLIRLGYISINPDGSWKETSPNVTTTHIKDTNSALKKLQREFLIKSINALENIPIEERVQSCMTFAIPSEKIEEAKEMIKEFRRKLALYLNNSPNKDRVYSLLVSFFPLDLDHPKELNHGKN